MLSSRALWVAGCLAAFPARAQEPCPLVEADYRRVVLVNRPDEPLKLAPLPDGRVLWVERKGAIKIWSPSTNAVEEAGRLSVFKEMDNGLHAVAAHPQFAANNWIFLAWDPASDPHAEGPGRWISRFTLNGNRLDPASEKRILHVPIDRAVRQGCCHQGGGLAFDAQGLLYFAVGENADYRLEYANTNESDPHQNSLRTSANTNDLRGKVLRIRPEADGTYSIPPGNLFPRGMAKTRPEIYAFGLRNPYSLSVDARTGWAWVGDVGPDAAVPSPDKGAVGYEEINLLTQAANLGYPFASGPNDRFRDYDYVAKQPKEWFNLDALRNTSRYNTGLTDLSAAGKPQPALVHWTLRKQYNTAFPDFGEGPAAGMVGPTYRFNPAAAGTAKLPAAMDGKVFFWDHEREWIRVLTLAADQKVARVERFMASTPWRGIVDIKAGADGTLYVAEYGHGYYTANAEAKISRIEYVGKPCGDISAGASGPGLAPSRPASARLALAGPAGLSVDLPPGARHVEVTSLDGRLLWNGGGRAGSATVPASALRGIRGLVALRFR